jgi:hypothetical protein
MEPWMLRCFSDGITRRWLLGRAKDYLGMIDPETWQAILQEASLLLRQSVVSKAIQNLK